MIIDRAVYKNFHCGNADVIQYIRLVMDHLSKCVFLEGSRSFGRDMFVAFRGQM